MTESFHLYLTATKIYVRRKTGILFWQRTEHVGEGEWDSERPETLNLVSFQIPNKSRLYVYLGSSLCRFMTMDLPVELTNAQERRTAALALLQHQLGLVVSEWAVTLDIAVAPDKTIACAIRRSLMERLSTEARYRLISVRPLVTGVWNTFLAKNRNWAGGALMVVEREAFAVLVQRNGVLDSMHALAYAGEASLLEREIQRLQFSGGVGDSVNFCLAVEQDLAGIDSANPDRVLSKKSSLNKNCLADFTDRFFYSEPGNE